MIRTSVLFEKFKSLGVQLGSNKRFLQFIRLLVCIVFLFAALTANSSQGKGLKKCQLKSKILSVVPLFLF